MTDAVPSPRNRVVDVACLVVGAALFVIGRLHADAVLCGLGGLVIGAGIPSLGGVLALLQARNEVVQVTAERDNAKERAELLDGVVQEVAPLVTERVLRQVKRVTRDTLEHARGDEPAPETTPLPVFPKPPDKPGA